MNQRRVHGETTLAALQAAYMAQHLRSLALRECERLDRACDLASAQDKQDALVSARYAINRAR